MTNSSHVDFLIVGQGLAGSILAHKLIVRGQRVMVIDNAHQHSASLVAAGIINPVSGHRLNLTEGFRHYYPIAERYYRELQGLLQATFWEPLEQCRLIKNPGQLDYYYRRMEDASYADILGPLQQQAGLFCGPLLGITQVNYSAMVHCHSLLSAVREWLLQQSCLISRKVDYQSLKKTVNHVSMNGVSAATIVFCEGHQAIHNPWLTELPFKLSKGAVLTLETDKIVTQLHNWGHWLVPDARGAKLGSSYDWTNLDTRPSADTEKKLIDSLRNTITIKSRTLQHQTGIRPTTRHRQPFIGQISGFDRAYCFNGFGSKGCLTIPHYAELLCQHLLQRTPLPDEVTQCL